MFVNDTHYTIYFSVLVPPRVELLQSEITVNQSETAILSCQSTGYPVVKIQWQYLNKSVVATDRVLVKSVTMLEEDNMFLISSNLSIREVDLQDAGRYVCICLNDVGSSSAAVQLHVQGRLYIMSFHYKHVVKQLFLIV